MATKTFTEEERKALIRKIILGKLDEEEQRGRESLNDSDIDDIIEECERQGVPMTYDEMVKVGFREPKDCIDPERPILYTVSKSTNNFGGLFEVKTKDKRGMDFNHIDVGVLELHTFLMELTEDLKDLGYKVIFEVR